MPLGPGAGPVLRRRGDAADRGLDAARWRRSTGAGDRPRAAGRGCRWPCARLLDAARGAGRAAPAAARRAGWSNRVDARAAPLWIWGAGHVGRALVVGAGPAARLRDHLGRHAPERFPERCRTASRSCPPPNPRAPWRHAPAEAEHLILTYSHALDLALCHALLAAASRVCGPDRVGDEMGAVPQRGCARWAMRRRRSRASAARSADRSLGKHPQAIARRGRRGMLLASATATGTERQWTSDTSQPPRA